MAGEVVIRHGVEEQAVHERVGVLRWIYTTSHHDIGVMYIINSLIFFSFNSIIFISTPQKYKDTT
mgnify:CR=1 FL=1